MALQMNWTSPEGTNYPECYIKIVVITAVPDEATLAVNWYADRAAWEAGLVPLLQSGCVAPISVFDIGPMFSVADSYLLTLPEFSSATIVP